MSGHNAHILKAALFAGVLMLLHSSNIQAVTPACGTTLTTDTRLSSNMNCSSTAIQFVGAGSNNVAFDCAGHSITVNAESTTFASAIFAGNVSGVTIQNCRISTNGDFYHGVSLQAVSSSRVTGNIISIAGNSARGIEILKSSNNEISGNDIQTTGNASNPLRIRSASNDNLVSGNRLVTSSASAINIQSSSGNELVWNTLIAPWDFLNQHNLLLQSGGMDVDSAGNIYAVENSWGSSSSSGIGTATAFIKVDSMTGVASSVIPLLIGTVDVGFGFEALEVLPNGRVLALSDFDAGMTLYEIDPNIGEVTVVALNLPALGGTPNGLEATSNTSMLATTDAGELLNIDLTTGNVTVTGQQGIGWKDLAVHQTSGKAYAVSRRIAEASRTNHLYEIDINTGQIIAEIGDLERRFVSDLDFAPDGTLYGNNGGQLIVIDPTDGSNTLVARFGPDPLEPFTANTRLENNLLQAAKGSIRFTTSITLPTEIQTTVSREHVKINFNDAMVDSTAMPFLDAPARIKLTGLSGSERVLLVDENDDDTFDSCLPARCSLVSFTDGKLVFDVTGFTTYSSARIGGDGSVQEDDSENTGAMSPWLLLVLFLAVLIRGFRVSSR